MCTGISLKLPLFSRLLFVSDLVGDILGHRESPAVTRFYCVFARAACGLADGRLSRVPLATRRPRAACVCGGLARSSSGMLVFVLAVGRSPQGILDRSPVRTSPLLSATLLRPSARFLPSPRRRVRTQADQLCVVAAACVPPGQSSPALKSPGFYICLKCHLSCFDTIM